MDLKRSCCLVLATATIGLVALSSVPANARDCTKAEAKMADDRLMTIEQSPPDQAAILKRHLPFGIHRTTHAADTSERNERLLLQDGYVMVYDGDLRTAIWTIHRLDGADLPPNFHPVAIRASAVDAPFGAG